MSTIARPRQLVLIRHAESARNLTKKGNTYYTDEEERAASGLHGIPDHKIPITEWGHAQARTTGLKLSRLLPRPDYVYDSGYVRTIETREDILRAYTPEERVRIKIRHNAFLRERDPGWAYDMTTAEANAAFPWLAEYWKTFGGFLARPPGGESLADVVNRTYLFLNMLFRDHAGENVWVVKHGGTTRCARFLLERWSYDQALNFNGESKPRNCGVTIYEYDEELKRLVLKQYNTVYYESAEPAPVKT